MLDVCLLGTGGMMPLPKRWLTALMTRYNGSRLLIDCGEGTQIQFRRNKLNFNKLGHIFISHLHGDHFFGLMGLISTFNLLGRTAQLYVHAPTPLRKILQPQLDYFCQEINYEVILDEIDSTKHQLIFEDRSVEVWSLPLNHRVPCCGFLFTYPYRILKIFLLQDHHLSLHL